MKHLLFILTVFTSISLEAQSDTLYLRNKQKFPVKLYEVSESEIRYRRADLLEGPIYTSNIENLLKIKYNNGTEQIFMVDELTVAQDVKEVVKQKEAYKFHVFDLPTGKVSFGYERVLRTGLNADFKVGYFNSNLFSSFNSNYNSGMYNPFNSRFASGTFVRAGTKFLFGEDMSSRGKRYSHLLNGAYVRFDAYISYIKYDDIKYSVPIGIPNPPGPLPPYTNYEVKSTDATNYNFGFLISVGKQHVLANILTLEYYAGLGFNGSSFSFTQSDYGVNGPIYPNNYYYYDRYNSVQTSNALAAQRLGRFVAGTIGFNIGYIHTPKEKRANAAVTK
jgi:hypothetical protein